MGVLIYMINIAIINTYVGCGKDTFSQMLKLELLKLKRKTNLIRLAGPGYEISEKYFSSNNREYVKGVLESLRGVDPDIWIDYGLEQVNPDFTNVIIDVRQTNELERAMDNGFMPIILEISKEKSLQLQKMRAEEYGKDVVEDESFYNLDSEIGAFDFCRKNGVGLTIRNDGGLEDLERKASCLAKALHLYDLCSILGVVSSMKLIKEEEYELIRTFIIAIENYKNRGIVFEEGLLTKGGDGC